MPKDKAIGIVKRKLWQHGFRVVERSFDVDGYHLLVEGKFSVFVRTEGESDISNSAKFMVTVGGNGGSYKIGYRKKRGDTAYEVSPRKVFGLPVSKSKYGIKEKGGQEGRTEENEEASA